LARSFPKRNAVLPEEKKTARQTVLQLDFCMGMFTADNKCPADLQKASLMFQQYFSLMGRGSAPGQNRLHSETRATARFVIQDFLIDNRLFHNKKTLFKLACLSICCGQSEGLNR